MLEAKRNHDRQLKEALREFSKQEDHLHVVLGQANTQQDEEKLIEKASRLNSALKVEIAKYRQLESRHSLEIEGYINEAKFLRMRLKQLQRISGFAL